MLSDFRNNSFLFIVGLGKTFIAAVVMYNFYRWFPRGKVVFMAPTKPLVHQQIESCYKVMGIPKEDTAEMTGNHMDSMDHHIAIPTE
jgi:Fanconi anemia group M protein